jgi:DNA-binding NarL/FixJ family response regulator
MTVAMRLRVALVDDHQRFRERLRALLLREPDIEIVAAIGSASEFLEIVLNTDVDVACMDIRLPGLNGIEATRRLQAIRPELRVIGLSAYAEPHYVEAMLSAGAVGHFTKAEAGEGLLNAIRTATREHPSFGADVPAPGAPRNGIHEAADNGAPTDGRRLGDREAAVLRLIAKGLASPQVAAALTMDEAMVDVYRRNIMRRLNLRGDDALREYARAWSLARD